MEKGQKTLKQAIAKPKQPISQSSSAKKEESVHTTPQDGDRVLVEYTGRVDNIVFDTTQGRQPFEFLVGAKEVIKGFEDAVRKMKIGDKTTVKIPPEQAYGPHIDKMVVAVPRQTIRLDAELKPGQRLEMTLPEGTVRIITIVSIKGDAVTIDLNHPLAGKTLEFEVELKAINS